MTKSFAIVHAFRVSNGAEVPHLAERFNSREAAERAATAYNSKAYTPFFYVARGS